MNIGEQIKKYRKGKMTQKELAEKIGVTTVTIQNYENNRREPNLDTIPKLADALGVPLSSLLDTKKTLTSKLIQALEEDFKTDAENTLELICELIDIDIDVIEKAINDNQDIPEIYLSKMIEQIYNDNSDLFINFFYENKKIIEESYPFCLKTCEIFLTKKAKEFHDISSNSFYYLPLAEAFKTIINKNDKTINDKIDSLTKDQINTLRKTISDYLEFQLNNLR